MDKFEQLEHFEDKLYNLELEDLFEFCHDVSKYVKFDVLDHIEREMKFNPEIGHELKEFVITQFKEIFLDLDDNSRQELLDCLD